jgi:hypothetical protein
MNDEKLIGILNGNCNIIKNKIDRNNILKRERHEG